MRAITVATAVLSVASMTSCPARAADKLLQAAGNWEMKYDGDRCVLSREFGEGINHVTLRFIAYEPDELLTLQLIGTRFNASGGRGTTSVRFGDSGPFADAWVTTGLLRGVPMLLMKARLDNRSGQDETATMPEAAPRPETTVTSVHFVIGTQRTVLALGPMSRPMAALRTCEAELVRNWGLDPAEQATLLQRPRPLSDPRDWIGPGDYPAKLAEAGEEALVSFRLIVGVDGRPQSCAVQSNIARDPSFAITTCRLLTQRARFEPARSSKGTPVTSYYVNRVRWIVATD